MNRKMLAVMVAFTLVALMLVFAGSVQAVPIGGDLSITGSLKYDTAFSFVNNAAHSGTMTTVVGGASTVTTYGATSTGVLLGSAVGANPLMGALTETGDGFGITGTAAGSWTTANSEFGIGIDLVMTVMNSSLTDIWQVTVRTDYGNNVDSVGNNAYVDSEFTLDSRLSSVPPPGTEEFFTHLVTDTVNGNEAGGNPVMGFGGPLVEVGIDFLVLTLNPGESYILEGDWTMEGGAFDDATSIASVNNFNVFASIDSIENQGGAPVPEPGTMLLLGSGLVGLVGFGRKKFKK